MTQMQPGHIMASDLIGTRVVSANNESIGDINDVIVDRSGQAVAAVIGVGGFLGIGEKDVAVPFEALEFATREQAAAAGTAGAAGPATTGATATGGTATTGAAPDPATAGAGGDRPERVILRMTKADLQAAPKFNPDGGDRAGGATTGEAGVTPAPQSPAPKQ